MNEIILDVEGIMCSGCEKRIETALGNLKEVKKVKASHKDGSVKVVLKENIDVEVLKNTIDEIGFKVL